MTYVVLVYVCIYTDALQQQRVYHYVIYSEVDKLEERDSCADIFTTHFERWLTVFEHAALGLIQDAVRLDQVSESFLV